MKKIYFIRHGETEGNLAKYFQTEHTPLTPAGHAGAVAVAERFKHLTIESIIASPFFRAQQTAKYISEVTNVPVETADSLHEVMQSVSIRGKEWHSPEGNEYAKIWHANFFDTSWDYDGAENHGQVMGRVKQAVALLETHRSENIIVISHGQFLSLLIIYLLLGKSTDATIHEVMNGTLHLLSNVAITEFIFDDNQWKLFTYNDHAHFAE